MHSSGAPFILDVLTLLLHVVTLLLFARGLADNASKTSWSDILMNWGKYYLYRVSLRVVEGSRIISFSSKEPNATERCIWGLFEVRLWSDWNKS